MAYVEHSISKLDRAERTGPVAARRVLAPWRRGAWSAEEIARALQQRRAELIRSIELRRDLTGIPIPARSEIVDDAICAVVMMRRRIADERHLLGAFWTAVRLLVLQYREGRYGLRWGALARTDLPDAAQDGSVEQGIAPEDRAELQERLALAADFLAELNDFERHVFATMAVRGVGVRLVARLLGAPVARVKAAVRSSEQKLERVAVISSAGRMCDYRAPAIHAQAAGTAEQEQLLAARAHLAACPACRSSYTTTVREMRRRDFQGGMAAAFLPAVPTGAHHLGPWTRAFGVVGERYGIWPAGSGERAAEVLGGAGLVKAVAAGSAVVVATTTIAAGVHSLTVSSVHPRRHPHVAHLARSHSQTPHVDARNLRTEVQSATAAGSTAAASSHGSEASTASGVPAADREFGLAGVAAHSTRAPTQAIKVRARAASRSSSSAGAATSSPTPAAETSSAGAAAQREFGFDH